MMLGLHGREADVDTFAFYLAHQLHMTVADLDHMPHAEYLGWAAYFTAKNAIETQRKV